MSSAARACHKFVSSFGLFAAAAWSVAGLVPPYLTLIWLSGPEPTEPTLSGPDFGRSKSQRSRKETDQRMLPFKTSKFYWFVCLEKVSTCQTVEYSEKQTTRELQRAYSWKCLSDVIDPGKASVVYRNGFWNNFHEHHISKFHAVEEAPKLQKSVARSPQKSDSRDVRTRAEQSALPVVRQMSPRSNLRAICGAFYSEKGPSCLDGWLWRIPRMALCWIRDFDW